MASKSVKKLAVVLLAAGCSSRLGQAKQLIMMNSESLLARQAKLALSVSNHVSCVLGFQSERMEMEVDSLPIKIVENEHWQCGLSSSIATGVNSLAEDVDAVILLLVDQWQLNSEDLHQLINYWYQHPDKIVACRNEDKLDIKNKAIGPPVIFPFQYFSELKALTKGQGARTIIKKYQENVHTLPLSHAFIDLDTPEQLEKFNHYFNKP